MKAVRLLFKAAPALLLFAAVLFVSPNAFAVRKFCTNIHYNYSDHIAGQDYLPQGSSVRAARAWMEIVINDVSIWAGYADINGCTPALSTPAGTVVTRTWPAFQIGSSYVFIFPDAVGNWIHVWNNLGNMAASTIPNSTYFHYSNVGYGYGGEGLFNVAAMMSRLGQAESGYDFGLRAGTYNILAEKDCPGAISCLSGDTVYLGYDSDLWGWDHHSRSVIGHEFGHYVQSRLFGMPGNSGYCASVTTANNALCRCDHVLSPNIAYCGTELVNQAHCLQSREYFSAALAEGWGHFFATSLLNNPTGTDAKFAYYKHFKRMDLGIVAPPVSHDPFWQTRWMEVNCPDVQAGRGVEIDWMGFLYKVRSSSSNRYTFSNFETVFESSQVCSGACNSADSVTWAKLSTAVTSLYASAKANYFINEGGGYGVDH
jgi:hypothetical protein